MQLDRINGKSKIELGADTPHQEILPSVRFSCRVLSVIIIWAPLSQRNASQ